MHIDIKKEDKLILLLEKDCTDIKKIRSRETRKNNEKESIFFLYKKKRDTEIKENTIRLASILISKKNGIIVRLTMNATDKITLKLSLVSTR